MSKYHFSNNTYITSNVSQQQKDMLREALRGEFEPGKYVRDMGVDALAGGAAGAIGGAGVLSAPGAAVGAISGAAFGLGSNAAADIAYKMYGDEGKAAWQAGDLQDKLSKMGQMLSSKLQHPEIGQLLNSLGVQYKNYVDVAVNKNEHEDQQKVFQNNLFNPLSAAHKEFKSALNPQQTPVQASNNKFVRTSAETTPTSMAGGYGTSIITENLLGQFFNGTLDPETSATIQARLQADPEVQAVIQQAESQIAAPGASSAISDAAAGAEAQIAKPGFLQPKNILNATWKGVKGLGIGVAVDFASNWLIDKIDMSMTGGEINMFRAYLNDIKQIITEINRLTSNRKDVVYAGNILWTNLQQIDKMFNEASSKKAEQPQQQQQQPMITNNNTAPTQQVSAEIRTKKIVV